MREILFRGKRLQGGEWVEGYLYKSDIHKRERESGKATLIFTPDCETFIYIPEAHNSVMIIPETVGQYIGLTDKNSTKIFEGDIVKAIYKSNYIGLPDTDFGVGVIEYYDTYYGGASYKINIIGRTGARIFSSNVEVEVIGNIHDNPELLEV